MVKIDIINNILNGKFDNVPEFGKKEVRIFLSSTFTGSISKTKRDLDS